MKRCQDFYPCRYPSFNDEKYPRIILYVGEWDERTHTEVSSGTLRTGCTVIVNGETVGSTNHPHYTPTLLSLSCSSSRSLGVSLKTLVVPGLADSRDHVHQQPVDKEHSRNFDLPTGVTFRTLSCVV